MKTVKPTLTARGLLRCPRCCSEIGTVVAWNPNRGEEEKMILVGGKTTHCPVCGVPQYIDAQTALTHNRFWFPEDPRNRQGGEGPAKPQVCESLKIEYTRRCGSSRQRVRISIRSQGQPILPGLLRGVLQLPGPGPEEVNLELDEG